MGNLFAIGVCEDMIPPPHNEMILRELLSWDALSPNITPIVRDPFRRLLYWQCPPSPFHWSRQFEYPWALHNAELEKHQRVLDVGSNVCVPKYYMAKRVSSVVCIDNDQASMTKATEISKGFGFENIVHFCEDVRSMPFLDDMFDRVFCLSMLEHIPEGREQALDEMIRVLKPGRPLLLTMDVRVSGENEEAFYIDHSNVNSILAKLGISQLELNYGDPSVVVADIGKAMKIVVYLIRWVKPLGEKK